MKKVGILLLTGTLLLCSCGQAKETAENSADVLTDVFAPIVPEEFFRVLFRRI